MVVGVGYLLIMKLNYLDSIIQPDQNVYIQTNIPDPKFEFQGIWNNVDFTRYDDFIVFNIDASEYSSKLIITLIEGCNGRPNLLKTVCKKCDYYDLCLRESRNEYKGK